MEYVYQKRYSVKRAFHRKPRPHVELDDLDAKSPKTVKVTDFPAEFNNRSRAEQIGRPHMKHPFLHLAFFAAAATLHAGIPEPDVIFYGKATQAPSGAPVVPTSVEWTVTGNNQTAVLANTTVVTVNSETFYVSRIPFETRKLADNTPLTATADTLELTAANTAYSRLAKVNGFVATVPASQANFAYGAATQGLIERIDLAVGPLTETYEQWSQRIFGAVLDPNGDADGDGSTNYQEYLAGTDPRTQDSRLKIASFAPEPGGGAYTITWPTTEGRTYRVERSTNLTPGSWTILQDHIPGTGTAATHTDPNITGFTRLFYRIVLTSPQE